MIHPFFENRSKTIQYFGIWIAYAAIQTYAFASLLPIPIGTLAIDSAIHASIYATIALLVWSVVQYGNFDVLSVHQRLMNHIALCALSIATWLGLGYICIVSISGLEDSNLITNTLPIRAFIGLLIYMLIIQQFGLQKRKQHDAPEPVVEEIEQPEVTAESTNETEQKNIEILERIAVKSGSKIHVVMIPEIVFLQADGDYVQIHTTNGKYLKEQTMKYFEQHLPQGQFIRIHRSTIVNIEMISRIELYEKQSQQLTLKNGQQVKTSPAGYKALRVALSL